MVYPRRNRPVRPIAYLLVAFVAAALCPTPDVVTMLYLFVPGVVLFESGYFVYRRRLNRRGIPGRSVTTAMVPTELELRAFVGSNAGYYLKSWQPSLSGEGSATGFNWAAFFFTGPWLGYRKMYVVVLILYGLLLAETVLERVVYAGVLKAPDTANGLGAVIWLVTGVVTGTFGNGWYLGRARRVIGETRSLGLTEADHLKTLAARGGASSAASFGLFLLYVSAVLALLLVEEAAFEPGEG